MPINIATDRLAVLEAMVRKEQELRDAATAQNPLAGRTAADMSPERLREIERLVSEQIKQQRRGEVGRTTVQRIPGQVSIPGQRGEVGRTTVQRTPGQVAIAGQTQEQFNIRQDFQGNYWNRIQDRAGGPVVIERLKAEYSPADQRRVEQIYRTISEIKTDPELDRDEQARQNALDEEYAKLSLIPKLPPIMQQPSPQEQFNAVMVETQDGQKGYWYDGKFTEFKTDDSYRDTLIKSLERVRRDNEIAVGEKKPAKSEALMHKMARLDTDILYDRYVMPEAGQGMAPALNPEWDQTLRNLEPFWGRASEKQMLAEMEAYKIRAAKLNISPEVAEADFLMRWQDSDEGLSLGQDIVARMSETMRKKGKYAFLNTYQLTGYLGAEVGGGSVTTEEGRTAVGGAVPTGQVEVKDKKGEVFLLPANELPEALKSGYTLVER